MYSRAVTSVAIAAVLTWSWLGAPPEALGQPTPGLAIFASEPNLPVGSEVIAMSSGHSSITGRIHSNSDIDVSGTGNVFRNGVVEYVTGIHPAPNFQGKVTLENCPVVMRAVEGFPVDYAFRDFAPGGREAEAAQAAGKYFHIRGDTQLTGYIDKGELRQGLYFVEGKIKIAKGGLHGRVTLVATKEITISGCGENLEPYARCLLAFSARALPYDSHAINVSGRSSLWKGVLFAPNSGVQISGKNNTVAGGALIGRGVKLIGGNLNLAGIDFSTCGGVRNQPPAVSAGDDQALAFHSAPVTITLDGTVADDGLPVGGTLHSTWSQLSGPAPVIFGDVTSPSTTATFNTAGVYELTLTADDSELSNSDSVKITLDQANSPPVAIPQLLTNTEDTSIDIVLKGSDPDGDLVTFSVVRQPEFGTLEGSAPYLRYTPRPDDNGYDSFDFIVNDGFLNSAVATVTITNVPVNDPPVADNQTLATSEDTPLAITLTGRDVDGDALTFSLVASPAHGTLTGTAPNYTYIPATDFFGVDYFTFTVNDGTVDSAPATISITVTPVNDPPVTANQTLTTPEDTPLAIKLTGSDVDGDRLTFSIVALPAHGTLTGTAPNYTYIPATDFFGVDYFTFTVNDGTVDSAPATISITVTPVNDPPVTVNQTLTTPEDTPLAITLTASDVDGDRLTFSIVALPAHGTLTGTAPNYTYVPATDFSGDDYFTFIVNDGTVDSAPATISITVTPVNDAPVTVNQTLTTAEDTPLAITLAASDVDGDPLTFSIVALPAHGTLTGTAPNCTYNPDPNFFGADSFTFTVNDGTVDSAPATISITVTPVNDPPVTANQTLTTLEDTPLEITLTATDVDDDPLTFSIVALPAHGTLTGTAPNYTYVPAPDFFGDDYFTFRVNDGTVDSTSATISITVTPVNDPPVVKAGPDQLINWPENTVQLAGSVIDDAYPDTFVTVEWRKASGPGTATFSNAQSEQTTVTFDKPGRYELELTASDSLLSATNSMVVYVNAPPQVDAGSNHVAPLMLWVTLSGTVSDDVIPPGNTLSVKWEQIGGSVGGSAIIETNMPTCRVLLVVPDTYVFRLTASDGVFTVSSNVTVQAVEMLPADVNHPPVVDVGPPKITTATEVTLTGVIEDDGLSASQRLTYTWAASSEPPVPGMIYISGANTLTPTNTFPGPGRYNVVLAVNDGEFEGQGSVDVLVEAQPSGYIPPVVEAGPDQVLSAAPCQAQLNGSASSSRSGALTFKWQEVSGPGYVSFSDDSRRDATASFSRNGSYKLRLLAYDDYFVGSDEVTIQVGP